MTTLASLRTDLRTRLRDQAKSQWQDSELDNYLAQAIRGLYPYFFQYRVAQTTADNGPIQTMPTECRNLYQIGLRNTGSTRVRPLRGWSEGNGSAFVPKTGIAGQTLVWSWTQGWDVPSDDATVLRSPVEADEVLVIRAQITALQSLLNGRILEGGYMAQQARQITTEAEVLDTIASLEDSLKTRLEKTVPLPEVSR